MGAFTDGTTPADSAATDKGVSTGTVATGETPEGFATDVEGCRADAEVKVGTENYPVFDVDDKEFYQNMKYGRKRLRFGAESKAGTYLRGTRYKRPFFVRHTDPNGKAYIRKIEK
jgi:hypothetical protein